MTIFFKFPPFSIHIYPLQVENCDSNSRLVVDEDGDVKFRPGRVKLIHLNNTSDAIYMMQIYVAKTIILHPHQPTQQQISSGQGELPVI